MYIYQKQIIQQQLNKAIINKMSEEKQIQRFKKNFQNYIKPYKCQHHRKTMNLLCIEPSCQQKGFICSLCLTINGSHKNHDAVEVVQYVQNCLKEIKNSNQNGKDQIMDFLSQCNKLYNDLLDILAIFVDNCSNIVKAYLSKKKDLHEQRVKQISSGGANKKIIQCKFKSIQQANRLLLNLSSKFKTIQFDKNISKSDRNTQRAQNYTNDLSYQFNFIGKQLRKIQQKVRQILVVKQTEPIVLNYQPYFYQPTVLQNEEFIYIGQSKNNKPNGKGICYYQKGQKIIFGQFVDGKVDGLAELYYFTKDYYLGQFKRDKKNGRGVYRWFNKQYHLYEGEFKDGRRNGRGIFWWGDGSKYCGEFLQGHQTGYGKLYRLGNIIQYEGNWLNGLYHGKGIQYFQNGEIYEGQFKEDQFHGQGKLSKQKSTIHGVWIQNQLKNILKQKSERQKN